MGWGSFAVYGIFFGVGERRVRVRRTIPRMDEVRRIWSRQVGADYVEVWQTFRDVTTNDSKVRPELMPGLKEVRVNGRPATVDVVARLRESPEPEAEELRRFLDG